VISLLCPTRGRPANVSRMLESVFSNDTSNTSQIVFFLDNDDHITIEVVQSLLVEYGTRIKAKIGPRNRNIAKMHNHCASAADGDILGLSDDDVVYRTIGWNEIIEEAFAACPDKILLAYGADGLHNQHHATHPFIHRTWLETTGYFVPEYFTGDYSDTWLFDVATRLGRTRYLENLSTEHMHPAAGKAEWDATYNERFELQATQNPGHLFDTLAHERVEDARKLQGVIDSCALS